MAAGSLGWFEPDALAELRQQFLEECDEHLVATEVGLAALCADGSDRETLNTVFRAVHSIKGGAGTFGMAELVAFAHVAEGVLAQLRSHPEPPPRGTLAVLLRAADRLTDLVNAARDGRTCPPGDTEALVAALQQICRPSTQAGCNPVLVADDIPDFAFVPAPIDLGDTAIARPAESWTIFMRPSGDLYRKANEPRVLLDELHRLGTAIVLLDDTSLPLLEELDPEAAYLAWTVCLTTVEDEAAIADVFAFVEGDCDIAIRRDQPGLVTAAPIAPATRDGPSRLSAGPIAAAPASATPPASTIRVDTDRVDRLVNLVSEIVIGETTLVETIANSPAARESAMVTALDGLRQLTRELQEAVMAIRAQPVRSLFQRMGRLVRETEAATGKSVRLLTEGEETEVDRAVLERLADPLTHMLRNAIDHGIEVPQRRREAGKPEQGTVRLAAAHRAGRIVIHVSDDGNGINRDRVRAGAVARGLIQADTVLSDEESDNLIFEAGFSTAERVSDLSGRGVGMDVVRRGVQSMGGRICVSSRAGEGTGFTLSLPLTLAVLDGMLVSVCGQNLVAPLTALLETVLPEPARVRRLGAAGMLLAIRGRHVPLLDLGTMLGFRADAQAVPSGVALLVEDEAGEQVALLVDAILGQRQVVIKSLEANYQRVRGVAAATILGDGRVALILDINGIIAAHKVLANLRPSTHAAAARSAHV